MRTASSNRGVVVVTVVALGAAAIACALVIFGGGSSYTIHAIFEDSGQLVSGGVVQVAGRNVGSISSISVTAGQQADVTLSIDDGSIVPLHDGTRAIIRTVGQAGVANRFVQLLPGPLSAPSLRDGATLPTSRTTGIVDLDAVLDTFDPSTRSAMQQLIARSSEVFAGSGAGYFNQLLVQLDPALGALDRLSGQLSDDRVALAQLVHSGAAAADAVASRRSDLTSAVAKTASALGAIATERSQLADFLGRAPGVLRQATGTLKRVATAVTVLRPALREVVPVGAPLRTFLTSLVPTLTRATPVMSQLDSELVPLRSTLAGLQPLQGPLESALTSTDTALRVAMPILTGMRIYGSDFVLGIFNGLTGLVAGPYDAHGHYAKLNFVQSPQTLFAGLGSEIFSTGSLLPGVLAVRTHQVARCPGGEAPPAPDGSSPWIPDPSLCNPADDTPLSVDFP